MRSRSGFYRRQDGKERLWYEPADIEVMMEAALDKFDLFPTRDNPVVNIESFIASLKVRMDQYADLDTNVLGLTEFYSDKPPKIFINRDLTGAIDDDNTPPGIRGRWRATMAHEASHVVMHRVLFEINHNQENLFRTEPQSDTRQLMRCLKKNVLFRGGGSDWREVQANMGMAALLMPQTLFRELTRDVAAQKGLETNGLSGGSPSAAKLTDEMSTLFDVSKQAARIRLETLHVISPARQGQFVY
jgi:hypothetical protein